MAAMDERDLVTVLVVFFAETRDIMHLMAKEEEAPAVDIIIILLLVGLFVVVYLAA